MVPADDEDTFLQAVHCLLADPGRLHEMGRTARQSMQDRSFDTAFNAAWKMYQQEAASGR